MTSAPARKKRKPTVPLAERLHWTLAEAAAMTSNSENYLTELEGKRLFPPRVRLPAMRSDGPGRKSVLIAAEVRAWAEQRDWRAMVEARNGWEDRDVA